MNIGVAITTTSARPEHKAHWENLIAFGSLCDGMQVEFVHDVKGVAAAKNESLRRLKDCDYVFLFDDDTFPIKEGWAQWFIDAHKASGIHHFSYLHNYLHIRKVKQFDGISVYSDSAGCMMFMTKEIIENVGAFNEAFGVYGYEHVEYSVRCKMSGLTPHHNICPDNASDYIYSMDLDSTMTFDFKHIPTLSVEEMQEAHNVSVEQFTASIQNPIIYLPL